MEMIEVISLAHFEDTRIGSISRKQVLKIPLLYAQKFVEMGLVAYVNPTVAVAEMHPSTDPQQDGVEQLSQSLQADQALPKQTRKYVRKNKEQKDGESLQ